jgi:hypothetical protein
MSGLIKYDAALRALRLCTSVDEVKKIRDQHAAFVAYARQAKNMQMLSDAIDIKLRAEDRAGALLVELAETKVRVASTGGRPKNGRGGATVIRLADLGTSKHQ